VVSPAPEEFRGLAAKSELVWESNSAMELEPESAAVFEPKAEPAFGAKFALAVESKFEIVFGPAKQGVNRRGSESSRHDVATGQLARRVLAFVCVWMQETWLGAPTRNLLARSAEHRLGGNQEISPQLPFW
jgi:hypothetical protein